MAVPVLPITGVFVNYFASSSTVISSSSSKVLLKPQKCCPQIQTFSYGFRNLQREIKKRYNNKVDFRVWYRFSRSEDFFEEDNAGDDGNFNEAVFLFNNRDYHRCHDFLEALWNKAEEPRRTLIHGILQCAVGFHHLFNQNHRGAMMELGEGLCKLRKMNFDGGPFYEFEKEISECLDYIYQTQLELAACTDDLCLTMDGSDKSYQLLGSFAAGRHLYHLETDPNNGIFYIVFCGEKTYGSDKAARVIKVPTLHATQEHLMECEYN